MTAAATTPIAVAQFAPTADVAANLATIAELVATASARGARLVVFPEYSSYFVDPFDASLAEHAQEIDGPFVAELVRIAGSHDVHIVAGLVERAGDARRVRNAVVAVDGSGVLARYRKLHLYDAFGQRESDWVEPGELDGARDVRARRHALRAHDLLRPALPRGGSHAGGCRRRRVRRAGRVGARPAEGAPLADAHPRAGDREHRLRRRRGPPAAARCRALDDRRSAGRRARLRRARPPTSPSRTSIATRSPACDASTRRSGSAG